MPTARQSPPSRLGLILVADSRFRENDVREGLGVPAALTQFRSSRLGISNGSLWKGCSRIFGSPILGKSGPKGQLGVPSILWALGFCRSGQLYCNVSASPQHGTPQSEPIIFGNSVGFHHDDPNGPISGAGESRHTQPQRARASGRDHRHEAMEAAEDLPDRGSQSGSHYPTSTTSRVASTTPGKSPTKLPELWENLPLPPGKGPHIK
jgi:hypothetical protein